DRLGDVRRCDGRLSGKVGDRARKLQHAVIGAGGEIESGDRLPEQILRPAFRRAMALSFARPQPAVDLSLALQLPLPRTLDAASHLSRAFSFLCSDQLLVPEYRHLDLYVNAIQQRP